MIMAAKDITRAGIYIQRAGFFMGTSLYFLPCYNGSRKRVKKVVELSKDARKLLRMLYDTYQARMKAGMTKPNARDFQFDKMMEIRNTLDWSQDDLLDTERELRNAGFIKPYMHGACRLEDPAILYMKNRWKRFVSELLDIVSKLKP